MQHSIRTAALISVLGLSVLNLSACGTLAPFSNKKGGEQKLGLSSTHSQQDKHHQQVLYKKHLADAGKRTSFTATGRIGITAPKEGFSAGFNWKQNPHHYQIRLAGPADAGAVEIEGTPSGVTLTQSNGQQFVASSPEQLIQKVMKVSIPVSGLRYWLQGLPAPDAKMSHLTTNNYGHILQMNQHGWHIEYAEYHHNRNYRTAFPKRVILKKDKMSVKFFIREWKD